MKKLSFGGTPINNCDVKGPIDESAMPARPVAPGVDLLPSDGFCEIGQSDPARYRLTLNGDFFGPHIKFIHTSHVNFRHAGPVQDVC